MTARRGCAGLYADSVTIDPEDWLPSYASHIRERAEREREHGIQWTTSLNLRVRSKLYQAFNQSYAADLYNVQNLVQHEVWSFVSEHTHLELNAASIHDVFTGDGSWLIDDVEVVDWLAALPIVLEQLETTHGGQMSDDSEYAVRMSFDAEGFVQRANDILLEGRVGYTFINRRLRERGDEPLHSEVVEPVTALLSSDPRFTDAEAAYQDAMNSLASGFYGSAVTSAASALQKTLEGLGFKGNDLGALVASARHTWDEKLVRLVRLVAEWATAERSNGGIAHGASSATRDDAQLAVHIAGAMMLRVMREPRGTSEEG